MYSIREIYDNGYKLRYASHNLEEINEIYVKLKTIIKNNNKLIIFDEINNEILSKKL